MKRKPRIFIAILKAIETEKLDLLVTTEEYHYHLELLLHMRAVMQHITHLYCSNLQLTNIGHDILYDLEEILKREDLATERFLAENLQGDHLDIEKKLEKKLYLMTKEM